MTARAAAMDAARESVERELADLIAIPRKLLRAGLRTGPDAPIVRTWISQHPDECLRVAEECAIATGLTQDQWLDASLADPTLVIRLIGEAAFAAAKAGGQS